MAQEIPAGDAGASIRRGLALVEHTPDSLPAYALSNLRCVSCHLDRGERANAAPLVGASIRYPKYMERAASVATLPERVNFCFTRSLAGVPLPLESSAMHDIVAYIEFISRGVSAGGHVPGEGMPRMTAQNGDSTRGASTYAANCARCHGADGGGVAQIPALWGARSYSIGASMARVERAASFIRHNMPFDRPGSLTDAEAYDLARFVNSHSRPDSPGKENDWPRGDAPSDVPYATKGHAAFLPPTLLPRRQRSISSNSRRDTIGSPAGGMIATVNR